MQFWAQYYARFIGRDPIYLRQISKNHKCFKGINIIADRVLNYYINWYIRYSGDWMGKRAVSGATMFSKHNQLQTYFRWLNLSRKDLHHHKREKKNYIIIEEKEQMFCTFMGSTGRITTKKEWWKKIQHHANISPT